MAASSSTTLVHALASLLFVTVLTIVAAQVSVPLPFTAVPLTLQPMVVLLGGLALGSRLGSVSQILYLAAGIAGLPVFAASAVLPPGPLRLLGPTGGYLMAYPLAAVVTNAAACQRWLDRTPPDLTEARGTLQAIIKDGNRAGDVIHSQTIAGGPSKVKDVVQAACAAPTTTAALASASRHTTQPTPG